MKSRKFKNKVGNLRVASNRRHLEYTDGTPFLYLADTAWELFHRLDFDEARYYLDNRAAKGFTVIQAVALAELGGIDIPNVNGELPLVDRDPTKPNEAYFRHVDRVVEYAEEIGLFIGFLPTWGGSWKQDGRETTVLTVENARAYGRFVGERYRERPIIWILGGDENIESPDELAVVEKLALGLKEGDRGSHLITFHPRGPGRSAEVLHNAEWLDFNMCQSSHGAHDHDNGLFIEYDYSLGPPKPTVDGEPRYETMPVGFYYEGVNRYDHFDDYDVRQAAYWALMAGACGHTYGHNCIWQMWTPERKPVLWANIPWIDSLDTPGAFQMGHIRKLFESYPLSQLVPAPEMVLQGPAGTGAKVRALRSTDGTLSLIYSARGESFVIDRRVFKPKRIREVWYDPRYGCSYHVHTSANVAFQTYVPPTSGRGNDWVLILEEERAETPYIGP